MIGSLDTFLISSDHHLSNHAPFHFDLSVFDLFVAAGGGATLHLVPEGLSTFPLRLAEWLAAEDISVWYSVPSVLTLLALHGRLGRSQLRSLRLVLFAGEVFPLRHLQSLVSLLPGPRYFNLYGPTETTVCTYHAVDRDALPSRSTPIPIRVPGARSDDKSNTNRYFARRPPSAAHDTGNSLHAHSRQTGRRTPLNAASVSDTSHRWSAAVGSND